ncbi:MAG: Rieske 2Fe-2S domain-containing protein [Ferruginibacter sp.]|jgi:3-phenylpropionate/trans-cinnamate dioxygenase ferredoxin subunit|nr:Rieske 2Fe-2S domain-containing protein [Ferruginibacter sp.]
MFEKNDNWHKIAESLAEMNFSTEGIATVELENKKLCIILFREALYACNSKCPHAGGNLAGGYIDTLGNIVCPLHRYKFNLQNGRNSSGEGYFLKTYPVEKRADGIFIKL